MAHDQNYKSRSAFKLLHILEKHASLISKGDVVVDCGAAPGGFSQVASQWCNANIVEAHEIQAKVTPWISQPSKDDVQALAENCEVSNVEIVDENNLKIKAQHGLVIAIDLLQIDYIPGVVRLFPQDFTNQDTVHRIQSCLHQKKVDVILSDMAHNLTGQKDADHYRSMQLCENVFQVASAIPLKRNGSMLMKLLQGGSEIGFKQRLETCFKTVKFVKPESSRKESKEVFLLCQGYQPQTQKLKPNNQ